MIDAERPSGASPVPKRARSATPPAGLTTLALGLQDIVPVIPELG